jgi:hypothetical protein
VLDIAHIVEALLLLIEALKWTADVANHLVEFLVLETEKAANMLYVSTAALDSLDRL